METNYLQELNEEISQRTQYGVRKYLVSCPGHIISWSNGNACWQRFTTKHPVGTTLTLDANEIFAFGNADDIDSILKYLDPLPLYKNSFEARFNLKR